MKTISKVIFFSLFIFLSIPLLCDDFSVNIYYLNGEKSKDSHSSTEKITINNYDVTYSVKYSGRKSGNQLDAEKTCTFSEQDIKNIKETITKKNLNVNDSLFGETSKTKSYEVYCNINLTIIMDGNEYKIRLNGDVNELDNSDLYKNAVFFITMLSKMAKDCNY